jgi:curli biogenesis system outer membrane secretion channel CsgG
MTRSLLKTTRINKMNKHKLILGLSAILFWFNGCGSAMQPKIDNDKKQIKAPVEYKTAYDSFLRDLGHMYRIYYSPNNPIYFQSKPITNDTGSGGLPVDVSKMVITAVSKVGKPIVYIPYDPNYLINELNTGGDIRRIMPKYVIAGAITEYDKGIMKESDGAGADFFMTMSGTESDGSASKDNSTTASRIVMDFFLLDYASQTMVSGVQSTKTITIFEQSKSQDFGFHIFGSGFGLNGSVSRKQGTHAALRLLIELSIAEILAKEAGLPYWKLTSDLKPDQGTIDKVYYDMDSLSEDVKIILLKEYLTKYGFKISDVEDPTLTDEIASYYELLKKDLSLGELGENYIQTEDLVKIHFNIPLNRADRKYKNSMAKNITPKIVEKTKPRTLPIENLFSNIDKLSSITNSVYVGSIVDANEMYKTPFSEELEMKIKEHIKQNQKLSLNSKPIKLKHKTRSFKKRKKVDPTKKQDLVELVGYVMQKEDGVELELQVLNKDSQRLRVINETFQLEDSPKPNISQQNNIEKMTEIAKTDTEMKTDEIFFMTDKGDTQQTYFAGEKIEFALGVMSPSYAYIFDIDSNLEINTLFDSTTDTATKLLQPEELYTIPSPEADFEIIASPPYGRELIKLIISSKPLDLPEIDNNKRSFKKKMKNSTVKAEDFIDFLRMQALEKNATLYEKTIIIETKAN